MRIKWKFFSVILVGLMMTSCASTTHQRASKLVKPGFVKLPKEGFEHSAYLECNPTGDYGKGVSKSPQDIENKSCFITTPELEKSENFAPIPGFKMVGMQVSDVAMPKPYASEQNNAVAVITDTFWRNENKTECILGTHLYMQDVPLADGSYWEVNDIARSGFAGMDVEIAYFYKPHSKDIGGNTEVLFRAGRTFTSVATNKITGLPSLKNAPASDRAISKSNSAAVSENWVNFTTDVSYNDTDGSTRHMTSMFYIKYPCDARNVVSKNGAIRFRTTGQNNKPLLEIDAPGLVPIDAIVEKF